MPLSTAYPRRYTVYRRRQPRQPKSDAHAGRSITVRKSLGTGRGRNRPTAEVTAREVSGAFASPDVGKDLADDRGQGDEAHDAHPLSTTAQERIDLVDAADEAGPRFSAGCVRIPTKFFTTY